MKTSKLLTLEHLALNHLTLKHLTLKHFVLIALLFASACAQPSRPLTLQSLTIHPTTGRGNFTVSVSYTPGTKDDSIVCHFMLKDDEFARPNVIGQITVRGQAEPVSQSMELEFSLAAPEDYVADCSAISNGNQVTADFTVTP